MRTFTAFAVAMTLFTVASAHATDIPAGSANGANVAVITDHVEDSTLDYTDRMWWWWERQWFCETDIFRHC